jgi:thioredoxin-like negative regulator of GroEL
MAPVLERVVTQFDNLELVKIDADFDTNTHYLEYYDVRSIPTIILEDESGKVIGSFVGEKSEADIYAFISESIRNEVGLFRA